MTELQKPRKLLFHIGHHKTGTTSIQYAFATDRVKLDGGRVLYPGKLTHNYLRNHVEAYVRDGNLLPGSPGSPGLATISERLKQGNFDVAVISGETFERSNPLELQQAMAEFMLPHVTDYAVICYVRPHAGRILSGFSENLKVGLFAGSLEDFAQKIIASERQYYAKSLAVWVDTFGEHMVIRPMIRSELEQGDTLKDFVKTGFGPEAPVTITPGGSANESLCVEDLLIVKLLQDRLGSRERVLRHSMGWELASDLTEAAREGGPGTKLRLHKGVAETIRTAYLEDAQAMDARFFGGRPLFRDDLDRSVDEALPEPQSLDPADYFSANALRTISVLLSQMNMMLNHESGSWSQFLRDRRVALLHGKKPDVAAGKANRGKRNADQPRKKPGQRKRAGKGRALSE